MRLFFVAIQLLHGGERSADNQVMLQVGFQQGESSTMVAQKEQADFHRKQHDMLQVKNHESADSQKVAAQFLIRFGMGPQLQDVQDFVDSSAWVHDQMSKPQTLHRSHFRKYANNMYNVHKVNKEHSEQRGICELGSRFTRFVFDPNDLKRRVTFSSDTIMVNDVWRSDIEPSEKEWQAYEGQNCIILRMYVRKVWLQCDGTVIPKLGMPRMWRKDQDAGVTTIPELDLESAQTVHEDMFLKTVGDCDVNSFPDAGNVRLVRHNGKTYRWSSRAKLVDNTPAKVDFELCSQTRSACGSRGEVGNEPLLGFHYPMIHVSFWFVDHALDGNGAKAKTMLADKSSVRQSIWCDIALKKSDQLRQRVAWALAQIIVLGSGGSVLKSEGFLMFYDIFVFHAFGKYRNILREVTWNLMMGEYLTYLNSRSYQVRAPASPDENYAREIMQLFTIGLWELHPNGTQKKIGNKPVRTYNNDGVRNFARVFTGFTWGVSSTNNVETASVHPMRMRGWGHDKYPKPDLQDGYLGDGYPLCSDLGAQSFLEKRSRYEFLNTSLFFLQHKEKKNVPYNGFVMNGEATGLCRALTGVSETLVDELSCAGAECLAASSPRVVKCGTGYYKYMPPPCVELFFKQGDVVKVSAEGKLNFNDLPPLVDSVVGSVVDSVDVQPVITGPDQFSLLPCDEHAMSIFKIGAFQPTTTTPTTTNPQGITAYLQDGQFDKKTVFQCNGKFFKNAHATFAVGTLQLRNVPSFMHQGIFGEEHDQSLREDNVQAEDEVNSLIDYLVEHGNTGSFVGKKLIQRFGMSSPSEAYVEAVANMWRTQGNLAQVVTAVVTATEGDIDSNTEGSLREPFLKLIHLLRSLNYPGILTDPFAINHMAG